jgi:hypothetical protein
MSALSDFFVESVLSSMTVGGGAGIGPVLVDLETMVDGLQTEKIGEQKNWILCCTQEGLVNFD